MQVAMTDEEFRDWLRRQDKPKTRVRERWRYQDPARHVKFGKRSKGEDMNRQSNAEIADTLLIEWYRWEKTWRPALGAPRISPSCRGYQEDDRHNEDSDSYGEAHKREMSAVAFCVRTLAVPMQQAIGSEMKDREVKAKVWRSPSNNTFEQALHAILPLMRKHADLMALFN